jgi:hypothetical protein
MGETLHNLVYRTALMRLSQDVDLTSEEWAEVPYLLRDGTEKLISAGMVDPTEIAAEVINIIRQTQQIRRSEKRVNALAASFTSIP